MVSAIACREVKELVSDFGQQAAKLVASSEFLTESTKSIAWFKRR